MFEIVIVTVYFTIFFLSITISRRFKQNVHAFSTTSQFLDFHGKSVIVTGGNSGLGYNVAEQLAGSGARVILACRDMDKTTAARRRIIEATNNNNIHCMRLNLASLASVREFCTSILLNEERIDILINNAGAIYLGDHLTEDGLQITWQVNYFAPFLLTNLLLDKLQSSKGKVVNVTGSFCARRSLLQDVNQITWDVMTYYNAKSAAYESSFELARRMQWNDVSVCIFSSKYNSSNFYRRVRLGLIACLYFGLNIFGSRPNMEAAKLIDLIRGDGHLSHFDNYDEYLGEELWKLSCKYVNYSQ